MDTPTGRPVVCSHCGKVNRHGGDDCARCGAALVAGKPRSADAEQAGDHESERSKTSPGRKRLVTRQSEDGSLEMVQLSPEEAEAEEIEISRGMTGEHDAIPPDAEAGDGDPRRNRILFGAVASAAILVALLAWPFAGGDDDGDDDDPGGASATDVASPGDGPRKAKLPPPPPPEPIKSAPTPTPARVPPPTTTTDGDGDDDEGTEPAPTPGSGTVVSPDDKPNDEPADEEDDEEDAEEEEAEEEQPSSDDKAEGEGEGEAKAGEAAEESDDDDAEE